MGKLEPGQTPALTCGLIQTGFLRNVQGKVLKRLLRKEYVD